MNLLEPDFYDSRDRVFSDSRDPNRVLKRLKKPAMTKK